MFKCNNCKHDNQADLIILKCNKEDWVTTDTSYGWSSRRKNCKGCLCYCIFCIADMNNNLTITKDYNKKEAKKEKPMPKKGTYNNKNLTNCLVEQNEIFILLNEMKRQGVPGDDSKLKELAEKIIKSHL